MVADQIRNYIRKNRAWKHHALVFLLFCTLQIFSEAVVKNPVLSPSTGVLVWGASVLGYEAALTSGLASLVSGLIVGLIQTSALSFADTQNILFQMIGIVAASLLTSAMIRTFSVDIQLGDIRSFVMFAFVGSGIASLPVSTGDWAGNGFVWNMPRAFLDYMSHVTGAAILGTALLFCGIAMKDTRRLLNSVGHSLTLLLNGFAVTLTLVVQTEWNVFKNIYVFMVIPLMLLAVQTLPLYLAVVNMLILLLAWIQNASGAIYHAGTSVLSVFEVQMMLCALTWASAIVLITNQRHVRVIREVTYNHELLLRQYENEANLNALLKISEERFEKIFRDVPAMLLITDRDHARIISANYATQHAFGATEAGLNGKTLLEIGLFQSRAHLDVFLQELDQTGNVRDFVSRYRRADGNERVYMHSGILSDDHGEPVVVHVLLDITSKYEAEQEVRRITQSNEDRNNTLLALNNLSSGSSEDICDFSVSGLLRLTASKWGFFLLRTADGWICRTAHQFMATDGIHKFESLRLEQSILYKSLMNQRKTLVFSSFTAGNVIEELFSGPAWLPVRLVCTPVFEDNRLMMIAAIADKQLSYDETDIQNAALIAEGVWKVILRNTMNARIREGEERFRATFEQAAVGICHASVSGAFLRVNQRMCDIVGYPQEELLTKDFESITHPDDVQADWNFVQQLRDGVLSTFSFEKRYIRKDGSTVWVNLTVSGVYNGSGRLEYFLGVIEDITERILAQKAVMQNERRLREAERIANAGNWEYDINHGHFIWSEGFSRLCGLPPYKAGCSPDILYEIVQPEDQTAVRSVFEQNQNERRQEQEFRVQHRELGLRTLQMRFEVITDARENPVRLIGTILDITERKHAEESIQLMNEELEMRVRLRTDELQAEQRKLSEALEFNHRVFSQSPAGILTFAADGRCISANNAASLMLDISMEQLIGANYREMPLARETGMLDAGEYTLSTGEENRRIFHWTPVADEDGRWLDCTLSRFDANDEPYLMIIANDITEIKRAEEEWRLAKESAEKADRSKSEFIANMSHEIRTPLNAVIGFSEILGAQVSDKKHKHYLESINAAGRSLLRLINDILDMSKIEAGMMEIQTAPCDLRQLLQEMERIFGMKVEEKDLRMVMDISQDMPSYLYLDESRLRQVLLNLIGNAVKFTDTGYVRVAATVERHQGQKEGMVDLRLMVEDTGIGVREDEQTAIFESFRQQYGQSNRKYGGTGLGLSISKRLVEMMRGEIGLASEPGRGSIFTVTLRDVPLAEAPKTAAREDQNHTLLQFDAQKVMVVDDVASNRDLIKELLESASLQVMTAVHGLDAVSQVESVKPSLVIMDIRMPVMDGIEATRRIKEMNPDIPVIALTASVKGKEEAVRQTHLFDGFLTKPVSTRLILERISQFIPVARAETSGNQANPGPDNFAQEILTIDFRPVLKKIEEEIQPFVSQAGAVRGGQARKLAENLQEIASLTGSEYLSYLASELGDAVRSYDITRMNKWILRVSGAISLVQKKYGGTEGSEYGE